MLEPFVQALDLVVFLNSQLEVLRDNLKTKYLHLACAQQTAELVVAGATSTTAVRHLQQSLSAPSSAEGWA